MPYLMKEYTNRGVTQQEQYFGMKLCGARMVIECAFGRLKARFGAMRRAVDNSINELPFAIYACFVLYNYCETHGGKINEMQLSTAISFERDYQPMAICNNLRTDCNELEGKRVRRELAKVLDPQAKRYICNHQFNVRYTNSKRILIPPLVCKHADGQ